MEKVDINDYKIARAIDLTNEMVIKYYIRETKLKPTPHNIHDKVYKADNRITSTVFELVINVMQDMGYIIFEMQKDDFGRESIGELRCTNKGLALYLNGGLTKRIKTESAKYSFYKWGQISVIVAGLYYIFEIIKELKFFLK